MFHYEKDFNAAVKYRLIGSLFSCQKNIQMPVNIQLCNKGNTVFYKVKEIVLQLYIRKCDISDF